MNADRSPLEIPGASASRRIRRELKTVHVMIALYCRDHHSRPRELCDVCRALWEYAQKRVGGCLYGLDKPTCVNCPVHCYKPAMRDEIRIVMRYAGPRMIWSHPILSLFHLIDGRRKGRNPIQR